MKTFLIFLSFKASVEEFPESSEQKWEALRSRSKRVKTASEFKALLCSSLVETRGLNLELCLLRTRAKSVREEAGKERWYAQELNAVGCHCAGRVWTMYVRVRICSSLCAGKRAGNLP